MIVDTAEAQCTIQVLTMLSKEKSRYNEMFRTTKVSHTTLQSVLRELEEKKFVKKNELEGINTEYEIMEKGRKLHEILESLRSLFK